jgi:cytosine/adenosine deaminase-related metal-dependent hydrolase
MAEPSVDPYLDTAYSAMEMVRSGVTTVQHLRTASLGQSVESTVSASHEIMRAYADCGMRVSYSYWSRDQNMLAHEGDEPLSRRIPEPTRPEFLEFIRASEVSGTASIDVYERLSAEYAADPRVAIQLAPANLHWCSDDLLGEVNRVSARDNVPMHMHLLETAHQREYARRRGGGTAIDHLAGLGLLGPRLTLGHAVWVSRRDLEQLARTETSVCHNCSSNLRLRSGIAPVVEMLTAGIRVGIGIDEAGINDDRDMLQELRMVHDVHRRPGFDPREVPDAATVLQMATEYGAGTTGFGSTIGRLEAGRFADLVMIDVDALARPYLHPDVSVIDLLVRRARPASVRTVVIGGSVVYDNGQFASVDPDDVDDRLAASMGQPSSSDRRRRALADAVSRALPDSYATYPHPGVHARCALDDTE